MFEYTKEVEDKWLKALRSGDYKQGRGALHNVTHNTFCCLGVLCDITGAEKGEIVRDIDHGDDFSTVSVMIQSYLDKDVALEGAYSTAYLPYHMRKASFLYEHQSTLGVLNDTGFDFEYIANYIEENSPFREKE